MHSSYFFSAGEVSGDIYAAELLKALRREWQNSNPEQSFRAYGLGGPCLQAAGLRLLADVRSRSAVGLSENLSSLPYFSGLLKRLKAWLRQNRPRAMVLVDFQGFNLQLAEIGQELGIPVYYLMAPQDWIWGWEAGSQRIARAVSGIFSVFPPEAEYYRARGVSVHCIGHPLLDLLPSLSPTQARRQLGLDPEQLCICWMPGSRRHEVRRLSPVLQAVLERFPGKVQHLQVQAADFLDAAPLRGAHCVDVDQRYLAMQAADAILGASGNMVLEAALLGKPVVALYKVSALTYGIARHLLKTPWVTLPNILLQRAVVPEYIQDMPPEAIYTAVRTELQCSEKWHTAQRELWQMLGPPGALRQAARILRRTTC